MKTLYLDLSMGAAGDMLAAALYELLDENKKTQFLDKLNSVCPKGVCISIEKSVKCGITGSGFRVSINGEEEKTFDAALDEEKTPHEHHHEHKHEHEHEHEHEQHHHHHHEHHHAHRGMGEIEAIADGMAVENSVRTAVKNVYSIIAAAESKVHGVPVDRIHFHEVGEMDAIADITAVCLLIDMLAPDRIIASPVHVGSGSVRCAHGILQVPAPATADILRGVPSYGGAIKGELCTPTGAALIKYFADGFEAQPIMRVERIGYGMGKKDFEAANCVRAMLGEMDGNTESVFELCCNIDDMSAERIAFAAETLLSSGALDVYTLPIGMKKSRLGTMICVLTNEENRAKLVDIMFKHTTTLGIRQNTVSRYTLSRREETIESEFGSVRKKTSCGFGTEKHKYEYEDIASIARETDMSMEEIIFRLENK